MFCSFFFFNDTATTEIYTLSLHDALPISRGRSTSWCRTSRPEGRRSSRLSPQMRDRKSTRLNSSHQIISYAVFCLKKKKKIKENQQQKHRPRQHHLLLEHLYVEATTYPPR